MENSLEKSIHCYMLGKGGVGKSTAAALMSVGLASKNLRVLLVSMDPAHNLSDIFEKQFSDQPVVVHPHLMVMELNQERWIKRYLQDVRSEILQTYRYLTAFNLDGYLNVMQFAPGLEEYALLLAFQHIAVKYAQFDFLVFDMPPTALSLRFFGLPALSLVWIEALMKMRQEIIRKKEMITRIKLGKVEVEKDKVLKRIMERQRGYENLRATFADPEKTRIHLVLNPDSLSVSESRRIVQTLKGLNMPVAQLIVNKMLSGAPAASIGGEMAGIPVTGIACAPNPLIGLQSLHRFLEGQCDFFENISCLGGFSTPAATML
jgi:arsenite/tail-anchored protein-transporting ATPase